MQSHTNGQATLSSAKRPALPTRLTGDLQADRGKGSDAEFLLASVRLEDEVTKPRPSDQASSGQATSETTPSRRSSSDEDVEDYDTQLPEAGTIITDEAAEARQAPSIPVRLTQIETSGTYKLTADDPEIRQILRLGLERKKSSGPNAVQRSLRDLVFTRQFTMFDRQNPLGAASPFHGFYTLFWMGLAFLLVRITAWNYRLYGNILGRNEIWHIMTRDLVVLAITDGVMVGSTFFGLIFQRLVAKGYFHWETSGWILQNLWQTFFLGTILSWSFYRDWQWPQMVFIFLHVLIFLMKQHSYAFYNGHRKRSLQINSPSYSTDQL